MPDFQKDSYWVYVDKHGSFCFCDHEGREVYGAVNVQVSQDWTSSPESKAWGVASVKFECVANLCSSKEQMMQQIEEWKQQKLKIS